MLIAEELLLLATDDESGRRLLGTDRLDPALGGALLAELALRERIGITGPDAGFFGRDRLTVINTDPTDDRELDALLAAVAGKAGARPQQVISSGQWKPVTKGLRDRLLRRLADAGVLTEQPATVLGIFPTTRWPVHDPAPERDIAERLRSALIEGVLPDDRTRILIALLQVTGLLGKVVVTDDRAGVRRRAKALAEGDWASRAVKKAIDDAASASAAAATAAS